MLSHALLLLWGSCVWFTKFSFRYFGIRSTVVLSMWPLNTCIGFTRKSMSKLKTSLTAEAGLQIVPGRLSTSSKIQKEYTKSMQQIVLIIRSGYFIMSTNSLCYRIGVNTIHGVPKQVCNLQITQCECIACQSHPYSNTAFYEIRSQDLKCLGGKHSQIYPLSSASLKADSCHNNTRRTLLNQKLTI